MNLFKELITLQKNAYTPYSKYKVAAIAIDNQNNMYQGVNVENASYGLCLCAERNAITNAISNGAKRIKEIHLLCNHVHSFGTPCGACLQFMAEFMHDKDRIIVYNKKGEIIEFLFQDLLPEAFRKNYFKKG